MISLVLFGQVVGMAEDACVAVAEACSVDRSLTLVTPTTVLQQAMLAAAKEDTSLARMQKAAEEARADAEDARTAKEAEEAAEAEDVAEAEGVAEAEDAPVLTPVLTPAEVAWKAALSAPVRLAVRVGRSLRGGE